MIVGSSKTSEKIVQNSKSDSGRRAAMHLELKYSNTSSGSSQVRVIL